METGIRPVSTAESLNKVICKHLFTYMLAYMGKTSYLCSVIKKEIVKQLKKYKIMKLTSYYFNELTEEQQNHIMNDFQENGGNADYLNSKFSREEVNAEVVVDEDFNLYDIKVFDPYKLVDNELYIYPDGWSNWLLDYHDPAGNDIDTILQDQDGYVVSSYCTVDERDPHLFYVYLDELESYWVEHYGQESWDKAQYEDLDLEIQQNDPELYGCGDGFNDKGKYLLYTTDATSPDIL